MTLYHELSAEVAAAGSLEGMHRILIRGSLRAAKERGPVFIALRQAGAWTRDLRQEQRGRDRDTVRAFAGRAVRERQLDRAAATSATVVVLGAIDPLLAQWRRRPTAAHARLLEEIYLNMVRAAYAAVPQRSRKRNPRPAGLPAGRGVGTNWIVVVRVLPQALCHQRFRGNRPEPRRRQLRHPGRAPRR